ncbi:MAG: phytanoyl-CoA dioxygenase family protein [Actinomycetota bacterium]|mgnify:CR=1 FL=1|nr:phytanoyl-CoA dioxygenase family protein [Actinomycetota bacterium]
MTSSESPKNILGALEIDGAVIIDSLIPESTTSKIANELRPYLDACPQGDNNFAGTSTKRVGALMARSDTCRDLALHPLINDLCSKYLEKFTDGYQLHFTQAIEISPSESEQPLHRDRGVWGGYVNRKIETQFSTIWAVTNFTKENGATSLVPGSQYWDKERVPCEDEIVYAEMKAGSVLLYGGSILHGGGPNTTESENRLGVLIHYCLSWLRQEENQYLSCPPEVAKDLPPKLRELMGYSLVNPILGYFSPHDKKGVELVSPKRLFEQ